MSPILKPCSEKTILFIFLAGVFRLGEGVFEFEVDDTEEVTAVADNAGAAESRLELELLILSDIMITYTISL